MFLHQLRSLEIFHSFHRAAADTQKSLFDLRLLEAEIISVALAAFSTRLFSLHQPTRRSTLLYTESSFPLISPASVVSSTNLIMRFPSYLDTQVCVNSFEKIQCSA